MSIGWSALLDEIRSDGNRPVRIPAYSELMPAPRIYWRPCGLGDPLPLPDDDPGAWNVTEWEQSVELGPGLDAVAAHVLGELGKLARGASHELSRALLDGNPAWPAELASRAAALDDGSLTLALPLALSRTQDDKGRVRWTLFGASHLGPSFAFWRTLDRAPPGELARVLAFLTRLPEGDILGGDAVRVLPSLPDPAFPPEAIPDALRQLVLTDEATLPRATRVVVTFRPFARLPRAVQAAYLDGRVRIVPSPASLAFFHHEGYRRLASELARATQIPLLQLFPRSRGGLGLRVPQSGWLDEKADDAELARGSHKSMRHHIQRTHRWQRVERDADDQGTRFDDRVTRALFSTAPDDLGLYDKPMARNAEVWTHDYRLLCDGPHAGRAELERAARTFADGGRWGYRFLYPPMRVGEREVYWHLPLVARQAAGGALAERWPDPGGVLAAERAGRPPVELAPRLLARAAQRDALELYLHEPGHRRLLTAGNVHKLLDARRLLGAPLSPEHARRLLTVARHETLEGFLDGLATRARDPARGRRLAVAVRETLAATPATGEGETGAAPPLTFDATRTRDFEERYWRTVATLAEGDLRDKNNADVVTVNAGRSGGKLARPLPSATGRDLELVGAFLHRSYEALFARHGMTGRAVCADHVFPWTTDFEYPWSRGWQAAQRPGGERNIVCVIPGRDRRQAVVMGDHYDTAYMEDVYEPARGGDLLRAAAAGADDNHSATVALLLAAEALLWLARDGKLARDVWLVHLTGEEFPADCLGARNLCERLAARDLVLVHPDGGGEVDLRGVEVRGAFILDMVAHNNDRDRDVFQISPGEGAAAARLALRTHEVNRQWNESVPRWNAAPERKGRGRGKRVPDGTTVPAIAEHLPLTGEVRPPHDVKSSLYNTDAQIFSDVGVPVVLLMENYDINRAGYHDTHDTMANIDLDYGAALVAIAIETVAQVATAEEV